VDRGLEHFAFRAEPEAVVDEFGIFRHQLVFEMGGAAVERDRFDAAMGGIKNGAARRLIHAARLHTDKAVLDEIEPPDAMLTPKRIERRQELCWRQFLAVERDRIAPLEINSDVG